MTESMRAALSSIFPLFIIAVLYGGPALAGTASGEVGLSASTYKVSDLAGFITVPVNRTGEATGAASVQFKTLAGTAITSSETSNADYLGEHGVLNWSAGDTKPKTITVRIYDSGAVSGSKQFSIILSDPVGATLGTASATISIIASKASASTVSLSGSAFTVQRANGELTINVTRSGDVSSAAAVNYATLPGSAVHSVDYSAQNGVLVWAAGD